MTQSVFSARYDQLRETLVKARREAGLTQAELATRLGKPQSYVSKIERGERRIDIVELIDISRALGVATECLLRQIER
ncbi:helix-turn-helix domain-containing protein [Brevundimonas sp. G8]|uniref:helix-turn-helix domain-containing protein n=1 Tax=Brevundimonas sp. G8 TaxID=1350776 RepID=UPI0012EFD7B2|nr:helix-turn-helix transcriptional regulator [Brevundimonas sp. G8]VXB41793.1 Transcriptional regulator [Brevundimonas sp. G8]